MPQVGAACRGWVLRAVQQALANCQVAATLLQSEPASPQCECCPDLVQSRHPEHSAGEERHQHKPSEPLAQLPGAEGAAGGWRRGKTAGGSTQVITVFCCPAWLKGAQVADRTEHTTRPRSAHLVVALHSGPKQHCQGLAEQHTLRANQGAKHAVQDGQGCCPNGCGLRAVCPACAQEACRAGLSCRAASGAAAIASVHAWVRAAVGSAKAWRPPLAARANGQHIVPHAAGVKPEAYASRALVARHRLQTAERWQRSPLT